jgi:hypothetical protein
VLAELRGYISDYTKGEDVIFPALIEQLEFAKNNAARSLKTAEANQTDNPTTRVHKLVVFLQNIKKSEDCI